MVAACLVMRAMFMLGYAVSPGGSMWPCSGALLRAADVHNNGLPQAPYRVVIVSKLKVSANALSALSVLPIHCTQWVQLN